MPLPTSRANVTPGSISTMPAINRIPLQDTERRTSGGYNMSRRMLILKVCLRRQDCAEGISSCYKRARWFKVSRLKKCVDLEKFMAGWHLSSRGGHSLCEDLILM